MSPRRQRALIALGFFGIGLLLTLATVQLADASNFIRSVLLFIWLPVVFVGTQILPNSITVPYDPVGHPGLYILADLLGVLAPFFGQARHQPTCNDAIVKCCQSITVEA